MLHHRLVSGGGGGSGKRGGVPRPNGRAVVDDGGEFFPLGLTFMWSLQGARNEPDRYRKNLEWAAARFDFKRPLYEVAWADPLRIDPATFSDHAGAIARDLDLSWELGLRSGITLSGKGTGYDLRRLARDVGDVIAAGRAQKVLAVEMQNEYSNGGDPLEVLEAMAREIQPRIPNMLALSTPATEQEAADLLAAARRLALAVFIRHTERNPGDHGWRDVRQSYDFNNDRPLVGADWEGPGPGSSGSTNTSPLQLAMKRAVAAMCGAPIFILHTGTGVYGDGRPSSSGAPRPANFWEIPNIDEIVSAIRSIDVLLPAGVSNWTVANTQWTAPNPVAPFQPHNHWEGDTGDGVNKAYAALAPDGRVIQMPCGVRGHVRLTASYALREVTVFDPISLQPLPGFERRSFSPGESMDLPGGGQDAMVAYVIQGRR
jgi:hypothetical protein